MDASKIFTEFYKEVFGEELDIDVKKVVDEFEAFYPDIVKIIQKDNSFFDQERIVFGRDLSKIDNRDALWSGIPACLFASFLHGDIKKKAEKVVGLIKNVWNASGQQNDEITNILNSEESGGKFQEIIQFILESRLAKIFKNLMESIDISEFELNIENPEQLIELIKNPENPLIKRVTDKIQGVIQDKIKKGEINQNTIISEIEAIKAKVIGLFGNIFNEALGGRKADVSSTVFMGNSPEARRQRMLARLQRKVNEKNSR